MREVRAEAELDAALALRERIFVGEQGVDPAADRDGRDGAALHAVAFDGDRLVGTCRVLVGGGVGRLGRMAVETTHRGRGLGRALLVQTEQMARGAGAQRIALSAQLHAESLYAAAGYERRGAEYLEEGITHVRMEKRLA